MGRKFVFNYCVFIDFVFFVFKVVPLQEPAAADVRRVQVALSARAEPVLQRHFDHRRAEGFGPFDASESGRK